MPRYTAKMRCKGKTNGERVQEFQKALKSLGFEGTVITCPRYNNDINYPVFKFESPYENLGQHLEGSSIHNITRLWDEKDTGRSYL